MTTQQPQKILRRCLVCEKPFLKKNGPICDICGLVIKETDKGPRSASIELSTKRLTVFGHARCIKNVTRNIFRPIALDTLKTHIKTHKRG